MFSVTFGISFLIKRLFMYFIIFKVQAIKLELSNLIFNNFKMPFQLKTPKERFTKYDHFLQIIPILWTTPKMQEN